MAKADNIKQDLDKLYDILREEQAKNVISFKEQDEIIHKTSSSVVLLNDKMSNLTHSLNDFIKTFKTHDEKEMEKYTEIEHSNREINTELVSQRKASKEQQEMLNTMQKNQSKFYKVFYIGTGIVAGIGFIASAVMWILNILSKIPQGI